MTPDMHQRMNPPFTITRVVVQVGMGLVWLAAFAGCVLSIVAGVPATAVWAILAGAIGHAVFATVAVLVDIATELRVNNAKQDMQIAHLKRMAEVQAAAWERRNPG